jgi:phosphohistidine phosphatase
MELYLLRHGIAEDGHAGLRDDHRKLTNGGRRKLREVLRVALRAGVAPTAILTSPLVRAVETAEIAAEELNFPGELIRTDCLVPDADPRQVWEEIRLYRDEAQLLLASHNPLCASLAGFLLGTPGLAVDYRKGAMMRVDMGTFGTEPRGVLRWLLTPKLAG